MKWVKTRNNFQRGGMYYSTPQHKKEWHLPTWFWKVIFVLIVLGLGYWFLFYSSYFQVKNIEIEGNLNESVKSEIEALKGQNIIKLTLKNTEMELANKQSSIKTLQILRGIPDTLRVKVDVRNPDISWKTNEKSYYVDEHGIAFTMLNESDISEENKNNLISITDTKNIPVVEGKQIVTEQFIKFILEVKDKFEKITGAKITEMKIDNTTFQVLVMTDKNFYVIFDTTREAEPQINGLRKILEEHINDVKEYVDMRVEGKAYYK